MDNPLTSRDARFELTATFVLGIATAVSAWCTYEAQLWNSEQLWQIVRANHLEAETAQATNVVTREALIDITTFANVLENEARGDHRTARYIARVARPEFRPALDAWLSRRGDVELTTSTPFDDEAYRATIRKPSGELREKTKNVLLAASIANENGDLFVMRTVMLALSLFFAGIASQMRTPVARRLAVTIGACIFVLTLVSLARLDRAHRPHRPAVPQFSQLSD
jgi:hypothetical protein